MVSHTLLESIHCPYPLDEIPLKYTRSMCHLVFIKLNEYKLCCLDTLLFSDFLLRKAYHYPHEDSTATTFWQECVYLQLQKRNLNTVQQRDHFT